MITNNRIQTRHLGSKSISSFQEKFAGRSKTSAKTSGSDDDDDRQMGPATVEDEEPDSYNYQPPNDVIESRSMEWIRRVVIGYNLCPFAERPLRENKLKISVVRGSDDEHVAAGVVYELIARSDESQPGTTVVVAPEYYPDDFEKYMSLVHFIEDDVMEEHELHGLVQIAPFHPRFVFDGSGSDGIDNCTNRSPYPMFHILREDEVSGAVDKLGGDASRVWSRNVRLLELMKERLGRDGAERAMRGEKIDGMGALLKEMKMSSYYEDRPQEKEDP